MITYYIYSLAIVPFLATRALIPIFATALIARFGEHWGWMAERAGVQLVSDLPTWMTSDTSLIILAIAALAELAVNKSQDLREMFRASEPALRGLTGFFLCFNLVEGDFNELLQILSDEGPTSGFVWGQSLAYSWSFVIGWAVFWCAQLRAGIYAFMVEADEDDDLGVQGLMSWLEDGVGFIGAWLVILLPVIALVVSGITVLGLYLFKRYLSWREEKKKVPCSSCATPIHLCATACPSCSHQPELVHQVGFLGMIKTDPVTDFEQHRHQMIARKRCRSCGLRLHEKKVTQRCPTCTTAPFRGRRELDAYLQKVSEALPKTLLICTGLSLIPVLGLIPGIIYYKVSLISGMRCYIPRGTGCLVRWMVRLLNLFLICLQPVPVLGMFTLPLMCLIGFWVYRGALRREGSQLPLDPQPQAAPA